MNPIRRKLDTLHEMVTDLPARALLSEIIEDVDSLSHRARSFEAAYKDWSERTEWLDYFPPQPQHLGKHKADILRELSEFSYVESKNLTAIDDHKAVVLVTYPPEFQVYGVSLKVLYPDLPDHKVTHLVLSGYNQKAGITLTFLEPGLLEVRGIPLGGEYRGVVFSRAFFDRFRNVGTK